MPLTGYLNGERVIGPLLDADAWAGVRARKVLLQCGAKAVPKRSRSGTQFFAHWPGSHCDVAYEPESADHLAAKETILRAAIAAGWDAAVEVPADNRSWVADVLVTNGTHRVALEVQWSQQTPEQYIARQDRYLEAGIDCYWFARHHKSANNGLSRIPIFELHGNRDGFGAAHGWYTGQSDGPPGRLQPRGPAAVPLAHMVTALLNGYPRRWTPFGDQVRGVRVYWAWHRCGPCETWMQVWRASEALFRCRVCEQVTEKHVPSAPRTLDDDPVSAGRPREADPDVLYAIRDLPKRAIITHRSTARDWMKYYGFSCPKCRSNVSPERMESKHWTVSQSETVRSPVVFVTSAAGGHWCSVSS